MKGQINIDYAVAAGVFITGVVTAIALSGSLLLPSGVDSSESLQSDASSVSENFESEVSNTITERTVYFDNGYDSFLAVVGVEPGDYSIRADDSFTASDIYNDSLVFKAEATENRILDFEHENFDETLSLTDSSFSNSVIEAGINDDGVEEFSFNGYILFNQLSVEQTGIEESIEGDVSGAVNYPGQSLYFYGGDLPEVYFESIEDGSEISISSELEQVETVSGSEKGLTDGFSGTEPLIFHNSTVGLGVAGPGFSYSSEEGSTDLMVEGSYYLYGFEDTETGLERAKIREEFPRTVKTELAGVDMGEAEELFDEDELVFRNRLGLGDNFKVSFNGMEKGSDLPGSGTVVSRSFEKQILKENGTKRPATLEVAVWE